jgi:membrane protein DedA with SNARE-associated domain
VDDVLLPAETSECQTDSLTSDQVDDQNADHHTRPIWRTISHLWRPLLGLGIAAAISVGVILISNRVEQFGLYGYPGVFAISLLGNATVILPAPSLAVVSVMGTVLNPFLVGLAAGAGAAIGELTGYLAGWSGQAVIGNRERYEQMLGWTGKYGLWVVFVLSVIPNPLFDLAGIAAGAVRIPVLQFLLVCWLGKTVKTTLFALGGSALLLPLLIRN